MIINYLKAGFLLSVGWAFGTAVSGAVAKVLLNKLEQTKWCQNDSSEKKTVSNKSNDAKEVKNQIGFRCYDEEGS